MELLLFVELEKEMSANQQLSVSDMGPNFDRLWSYQCPLTKGRNVSSMSWNKLNPVSIFKILYILFLLSLFYVLI